MWKKAPPCLSVMSIQAPHVQKHTYLTLLTTAKRWSCQMERLLCLNGISHRSLSIWKKKKKKYSKTEARQNLCKENNVWRTNPSQQLVATVLYTSAFFYRSALCPCCSTLRSWQYTAGDLWQLYTRHTGAHHRGSLHFNIHILDVN